MRVALIKISSILNYAGDNNMFIRSLFSALFLMSSFSVASADQFFLDFTINQGDRKNEGGKFFVSNNQYVWSKGTKRTYAKVRCMKKSSGQHQSFSMLDLFSGVRITHELDGGEVKLTVVRNTVQPVLKELRSLAKDECRELSPIVTTTTQQYSFPAKTSKGIQYAFGEKYTFNVKLNEIGFSKNK